MFSTMNSCHLKDQRKKSVVPTLIRDLYVPLNVLGNLDAHSWCSSLKDLGQP